MITRKTSYREDNLITLVHKFCVKESARLIGPFYSISENEVEEPELLFDYELFAEVIQDKIAATFNDKHLELFHAMLKMVRYLGNKENRGEDGSENEPLFGVNTFAPVWEAMVDKIFGKLPQGVAKDKFNPHCEWDLSSGVRGYENTNYAMRPDTIMALSSGIFVIDAKYYKFGLTRNPMDLPSSGSICKQIAYAEYVEQFMQEKEIPAFAGMTSGDIYNAFIMPFCADDEVDSIASLQSDNLSYKMQFIGHCSGNWKDSDARPYHKIAGILLDMKSVMRNYANNPTAQSELAGVIKNHVSPYSPVCSPNTVARQIETHSVLFDKEHAALFAESRSHRLG